MKPESQYARNQRMIALHRLREIVEEGLQHGFFDCTITCEIIKQGKRRLIIKAGKSHQFIIPEEDLST